MCAHEASDASVVFGAHVACRVAVASWMVVSLNWLEIGCFQLLTISRLVVDTF